MTNASMVVVEPITSGTLEPNLPERRPPNGARDHHCESARDQEEARLGDGRAKAVAVARGRLHELWDEDEGAVHPESDQEARRFVVQTPRSRIIRMSTSGLSDRVSAVIQATARIAAAIDQSDVS